MSRPAARSTPPARQSEDKDLFTSLSRVLTSSAAFAAMTPVEMRLYISLAVRHTGKNNGQIVLGSRDAAEDVGCNRKTAMAAFLRLEELGIIVRRYKGKLLKDDKGNISGASERRASEWELTDFHTWEGDEMVPASRTYTDWSPKAQAIVPGSRSPTLPKPRAGAKKLAPPGARRASPKSGPTWNGTVWVHNGKRITPEQAEALEPSRRSGRAEPVEPGSVAF